MSDWTHTYIGRKPCKCVVAAVADCGDRDTAKSVADFIESGLTVERVPSERVREIPFGCKCGVRQLPLPRLCPYCGTSEHADGSPASDLCRERSLAREPRVTADGTVGMRRGVT